MNLLFPEPLEQLRPTQQLLFLIAIVLFCATLGATTAQFVLQMTNIDMAHVDWKTAGRYELNVMKLVQIISSFCVFVLPALVYAYLQRKNWTYLQLRAVQPTTLLLTLLTTLCLMAGSALLMEWNQQLDLPDALQSVEKMMRAAEEQAAEATSAILNMSNWGDFVANLFMVALLPAIGEELLFRGSLQPTLERLFKHPHWAIWITAATFSFIHFQFYGFLPRMILGAAFGYLYYWSNNLWYPIVAHFLNNGLVVVAVFLLGVSPDATNQADGGLPWYMAMAAMAITFLLLRRFRQQFEPQNSKQIIL